MARAYGDNVDPEAEGNPGLLIHVMPPFVGDDAMEDALKIVSEHYAQRGFERAVVEPQPGMGASAGGLTLGILARVAVQLFKAVRQTVRIVSYVRRQRDIKLIDEHRRPGTVRITHTPFDSSRFIELLVQTWSLSAAWEERFPGGRLLISLTLSVDKLQGVDSAGLVVDFNAADLDRNLLAKIIRKVKKDLPGRKSISIRRTRITGMRRIFVEDLTNPPGPLRNWMDNVWRAV